MLKVKDFKYVICEFNYGKNKIIETSKTFINKKYGELIVQDDSDFYIWYDLEYKKAVIRTVEEGKICEKLQQEENVNKEEQTTDNPKKRNKFTEIKYQIKKDKKIKTFRFIPITAYKLHQIYLNNRSADIKHIGSSILSYINLFANNSIVIDNIKGLASYTFAYHRSKFAMLLEESKNTFSLNYIKDPENIFVIKKRIEPKRTNDIVNQKSGATDDIHNDLFPINQESKNITCNSRENEILETQSCNDTGVKLLENAKDESNGDLSNECYALYNYVNKEEESWDKFCFDSFIIVGHSDNINLINKYDNIIYGNLILYIHDVITAIETYNFLFESKKYVDVRIYDFFNREWQVQINLRPSMNDNMQSGYVIQAIKINTI